jgi:DNA-binding NtrC family response regulator
MESYTAQSHRVENTFVSDPQPTEQVARTKVIVLATDDRTATAVATTLDRRGYGVLRATSTMDAVHVLSREPSTAVVVAALPADGTARELLERLRDVDTGVPVVLVGHDDAVATSGDAIDLGAADYLENPLRDPTALLSTVGVLAGTRQVDRQLRYLRAKDAPRGGGWSSIVGESELLLRIVSTLKQICSRTSAGAAPTIFLAGETGTGKGFIAKSMHYCGPRRNRPFVDVNCAALPATLIEAELFGHERGSFTDAKTSRAGLFETADGGTLFLDEIGAIPHELQAKLLTAIDEKRVRRLGGRHSVPVDVQIVTATHEDLRRRVKEGAFREDLFHRLNVVTLRVPPLRERGRDVLLLAGRFLEEICREYGMPPREIEPAAERWMLEYSWPGNVRELRNQIERVVLLENGPTVRVEHLQALSSDKEANGPASVRVAGSGDRLRVSLPREGVSFEALEREVLRQALLVCDGNVSRAARFLSMTRQTLIYRMKKHGLESEEAKKAFSE